MQREGHMSEAGHDLSLDLSIHDPTRLSVDKWNVYLVYIFDT